jgi:putative oxidoreductase
MGPLYDGLRPFAIPTIRIAAGLSAVPHGYMKLFTDPGVQRTAEFFAKVGYEPALFLAYSVALIEFVGGLCLAAGLLTRPIAATLAVFMFNAVLFHAAKGFFWNMGGYEYPLVWMILCLTFVIKGGGRFSIDAKIGKEF